MLFATQQSRIWNCSAGIYLVLEGTYGFTDNLSAMVVYRDAVYYICDI